MKKSSYAALWIAAIVLFLYLGSPLLGLGFRTQPEDTKELLKRQGYTQVQTDGFDWLACGEGDWYATSFKAERGGEVVEGTVCSGLFKNSTVRLE